MPRVPDVHGGVRCEKGSSARLRADVDAIDVDRQAEWFEFFVGHAGINRSGLFGDAWLPISGKPGFYFPPGAGTATGNVHPTNATGRLAEFYTERTAHLVAESYIHDFRYFDYCKGYHCLVEGDLD